MSTLDFDIPVESVVSISDLVQDENIGSDLIPYLKENNKEIYHHLFRQTDGTVVVRHSLVLPLIYKYLDWLKQKQLQEIAARFGSPLPEITYSLPDGFEPKETVADTLKYALSLTHDSCLEAISFRHESGLNFIKSIAKFYENYQTALQKLKKEADELYAGTTPVYTFGGGDRPA